MHYVTNIVNDEYTDKKYCPWDGTGVALSNSERTIRFERSKRAAHSASANQIAETVARYPPDLRPDTFAARSRRLSFAARSRRLSPSAREPRRAAREDDITIERAGVLSPDRFV